MLRAGVGVQLRDVFGFGEQLSARLQAGQAGGLVSGSLSGLLPVGGQGWKLGASVSHLTYELAGSFRALGAWGKADSAGLELQYAALRSASANVALRAAWESRRLTDEIQFQPERSRHKRNEVFTFGVTADRRDDWGGGGSTLAAFTVTAGDLRLLDDAAAAADAASLGTARHYRKLLGQVGRQQALAGPVNAYVRLLGQATGGNLDSVEKLSLGGAYGVRAYAPGEAAVDQGGLATVELRWQLDYLGGGVTLSLFHDRGEGLVNRQPLSLAGNYAKLYGSGLGLAWSRGDWSLSTSLAWRGGREPQADGGDPRPRLYFQLSASP